MKMIVVLFILIAFGIVFPPVGIAAGVLGLWLNFKAKNGG